MAMWRALFVYCLVALWVTDAKNLTTSIPRLAMAPGSHQPTQAYVDDPARISDQSEGDNKPCPGGGEGKWANVPPTVLAEPLESAQGLIPSLRVTQRVHRVQHRGEEDDRA